MRRGPTASCAGLLLLAGLVFPGQSLAAEPERPWQGWEAVDDRDGIAVYRRNLPGSPILAVGAEAVLEASAAEVCSILLDFEAYPKWVDRVQEVAVLERHGPGDVALYSLFDLPWPFSDRDFVVRMAVEIDPKQKRLVLFERSVIHPARGEAACCVRAEVMSAAFRFRQLGPRRTSIVSYAQIDFRGAIPGWVERIIQAKFPRKTIEGYRKRLAMPDLPLLPVCAPLASPT